MKPQKKNFQLYRNSPIRNNFHQYDLSPTKNNILLGVTFTKKSSIRTLNNSIRQRNNLHSRIQTYHSIQQIHHSKSVENVENQKEIYIKDEDESNELFGKSYSRIKKMKVAITNKNIDKELNDILVLIRQEKAKIEFRMKQLEKSNSLLRKVCEGSKSQSRTIGINTIDCGLSMGQKQYRNQQAQWEGAESMGKSQDEKKTKKIKQAYVKLKLMLMDMSINPLDILPQEFIDEIDETKNFKNLSDLQKIKIQQFFIRKLTAKMSKN